MNKYKDFFDKISNLNKAERLQTLKKKFPLWKKWWVYFLVDDPEFIQRACEKAIIMEEYDIAEFLVSRGASMADAMRDALKNKKFLGEKLRFIRNLKDLSLRELAEKIGITKMAISNWENGVAQPSKENILKLCDIFNMEYDYFYKENVHDLSKPKFRKEYLDRIQLSDTEKLMIISDNDVKMKVEIVVENYLRILRSSPVLLSLLPEQAIINVETEKEAFAITENLAKKIRTDLNFGAAPISNMIRFAEKTGAVVHEMELPDNIKAFQFYAESVPFIFVNRKIPLLKKRFSVGHELAHFLIDVKKGYIDDIQQGNDKPTAYDAEEALCHYFAGALLVGDSVLIERFSKVVVTKEELVLLEREYGISCLGLLYRLIKLRIIDWKLLHKLEKELYNDPNDELGEEGEPIFAHESLYFRNF
ncbi:MAG TPA: XRE family transcriptional regulator [bacterium]|nr:XRE family transcriptional regulator [bacterium]